MLIPQKSFFKSRVGVTPAREFDEKEREQEGRVKSQRLSTAYLISCAFFLHLESTTRLHKLQKVVV